MNVAVMFLFLNMKFRYQKTAELSFLFGLLWHLNRVCQMDLFTLMCDYTDF